MKSRLLLRASAGHLSRHPWQLALAVLGVALGVAVVVGIDLVRVSARSAFAAAVTAVTGTATHSVLGSSGTLAEHVYVDLRRQYPELPMAPIVESTVRLRTTTGIVAARLIGIDPFAEATLRRDWQSRDEALALAAGSRLVAEPGAVVATAPAAARLGLRVGESGTVEAAGRTQTVTLIALLDATPGGSAGLDDVLLADIATAQEVLATPGRLTRIDLRLAPADGALGTRIERALPDGVLLTTTAAQTHAVLSLTDAFYTNLRALSLLALVVGMFLIYNTLSFLVVQRYTLFGQLRTLGFTRGELLRLALFEAALLGAVGALAGLLLGVALAQGLLGLVTRTVNDLYFPVAARHVVLDAGTLTLGFTLGLVASLVAAFAPARMAMQTTPRSALARASAESRAQAIARRGLCASLVAAALAVLLARCGGSSLAAGFAVLFCIMVAAALATPTLTVLAVQAVQPLAARLFGVIGRLAIGSVAASLSRTSVAIAALMLAVATTVGIGIMIGSFRSAVSDWLAQVLRADVYVTAQGSGAEVATPLDDALRDRLTALPEVAAATSVRRITLAEHTGSVHVAAYALVPRARGGFQLLDGHPDDVWQRFDHEDVVLVSEPYAFRRDLAAGSVIELPTDRGPASFHVLGVYRDYGSEQGTVAMSQATFARHYTDRRLSGIGLYARPGITPAALRNAVATAVADRAGIAVVPSAELRTSSLVVFDRTFAITAVLRLLAAVIAAIGILSALMALALERTRETGIYRALGFTRAGVAALLIAESAFIGLISGLLALPCGLMLARVLVDVVNRRSFGWSMPLSTEPARLLEGVLIAVIAATLAALLPAWRLTRLGPAAALRDE